MDPKSIAPPGKPAVRMLFCDGQKYTIKRVVFGPAIKRYKIGQKETYVTAKGPNRLAQGRNS